MHDRIVDGDKFKGLIIDRGLSIFEFGRRANLSPSMVKAVIQGERHFSPAALSRVCKTLGARPEEFSSPRTKKRAA